MHQRRVKDRKNRSLRKIEDPEETVHTRGRGASPGTGGTGADPGTRGSWLLSRGVKGVEGKLKTFNDPYGNNTTSSSSGSTTSFLDGFGLFNSFLPATSALCASYPVINS